MKKIDLKKLALMGITGGITLASGTLSAGFGGTANFLGATCGASTSPYSSQSYYAPENSCSAGSSPYGSQTYYSQSSNSCSASTSPNWYGQDGSTAEGSSTFNSNPSTYPSSSTNYNDGSSTMNSQPQQNYYYNSGSTQQPGMQNSQQNFPSTQRNNPNALPQNSNNGLKDNTQGYVNSPSRYFTADNDSSNSGGTMTQKQMSESELLQQLDDQGKTMYRSLSPEGKALALKLASQDCKGKNSCKGLNSCKTSENSCAGKGACAGKSKGPFADKNLAVKVALMKMAEKRNSMNK